ncbi:hypothetical protein CBW24_04195 [Pacificitalea manganoxidans]|uniref:Beta-barrel assembly complex subunit BamF n=1 Tax=Pacificitalea manganoxidans TaxID=1411902 RepID=A0A291LX46_9RHOB|nr:hypothetical protein [Pacificitalea manganoxidans]MAQ47064.1 hypothetical protein [Actibacterium sp.]OWU69208.1 hypothetical protein ATO2_08925 [Roseovarius sp. 22II1-1F6A]ATI41279.1 hypothetical protein CBW24_04195 [Pacificitalea manganoxidans]MBF52339.1 hypothetical protein [Actibacterium sp.]MDR6308673.1 hypothetical protein [Pacificitalea manganoxidans]|tara:strand:- start:350 stop:604 length:255 start_codon:yes stop_codon:yes gene_type:complete
MPRALPILTLCLAPLLAGCTEFPELDAAITPEARQAAYPTLLPIDQITGPAYQTRITGNEVAELETAGAAHERRADYLRTRPIE